MQLTPWGREVLLGGRWAPGFAGGDGVQASPSRARPASVRPVCCAFPGPAPLPAARAPPPAAPRRGLFTVRGRPAPQPPPLAFQAEAEWPLQSCLQLRRAVCVGWRVGLQGSWEREAPPPPASPVEHGSLVATLLIAKKRLGVGWRCACVCVCMCVLGESVFEGP